MEVTQKRAVCQPQKVASLRLVLRGESKRMIDDDDSIQAIALEQPKTIQVAAHCANLRILFKNWF